MNSPTITMEKDAAVKKLDAYEQAARENPKAFRELDRGILQGYRVLARGGRLVDVNEAIKVGGLNLAGLPKLAIARAHVYVTRWRRETRWETPAHGQEGSVPTGGGAFDWSFRDQRITDDRVRWAMAAGTFAPEQTSEKAVRAMVPLVPLPLRPKHKLENYFVLWEANWHPEPPRDPYLLRPLAGSLMEIIAEWDLTPLEIAAVRNGTR